MTPRVERHSNAHHGSILCCMMFYKIYCISFNKKTIVSCISKEEEKIGSFCTCASSPRVKPKQTADMFLLFPVFSFLFILYFMFWNLSIAQNSEVLSEIFVTTTLVLVECYSLWHESFTIFSSGFPFCHRLFSSLQSSVRRTA